MSNDVTIKLKGDKKQLDKTLKSSEAGVEKYAKAVKAALVGIASVVAVAATVKTAFNFAREAVQLANVQAAAETKLAAVLKATGQAAGFSLEQLKNRAAVLQDQLGIGDEVILNNQAILATFKEIKGDTFEEATIAAADMAAVMDGDLKSSIVQVGKALNDPIKGVSALADVGVSFTDAQREQIKAFVEAGDVMSAQKVILDELKGEFGGAAEAAGNTFAGQLQKLRNTVGDLYEGFGNLLLPILRDSVAVARTFIEVGGEWFNSFAGMQGATTRLSASIKSFTDEFVSVAVVTIIDSLTFIEQAWANWYLTIDKYVNLWLLGIVSAWEELKFLFTTSGPEYVRFFAEAFGASLTNMVNFTGTALTNLSTNIWDFLQAVQSWLQGDGFNFEFTGLTKGFEATLVELPQIAERQLSGLEEAQLSYIRSVDKQIQRNADSIAKKNDDLKAKLLASIQETRQASDRELTKVDSQPAVATKSPVAKASKQMEEAGKEVAKAAHSMEKAAEESAAGQTTSLEGLFNSISEAAFGRERVVELPQRANPLTQQGQMALMFDGLSKDKAVEKKLDERAGQAEKQNAAVVKELKRLNTGVV